MKTIQTRVYTNVILTAIAVLLAVLAFQPVLQFTSNAYAQRDRDFIRSAAEETASDPAPAGDNIQAGAQREIARAIEQLARAVESTTDASQESADAQRDIADAIRSLGNL